MSLKNLTLLFVLATPFLCIAGCGGSSGPAELGQTYEPVTAEERKEVEAEKEVMGQDFVPPE